MVLRKEERRNLIIKKYVNLLSCFVVKEQVAAGPSPTTLTAETSQE